MSMFDDIVDYANFESATILNSLAKYELESTIKAISAMLLNPYFQENNYRLEMLLYHVLGKCRFKKGTRATRQTFSAWLNSSLPSSVRLMEDPAEDAFIVNVRSARGDFLIVPGQWESIDTALTMLLYILSKAPSAVNYISNTVYDMLRLSNEMILRAGLSRWEYRDMNSHQESIHIPKDIFTSSYYESTLFKNNELINLGISINNIDKFCFDETTRKKIAQKKKK